MSESIRKLLTLLASQLPIVGGLWAKWSFVQQRPLVAASIGVGYEALVFGGAFIKKVWEDELKKDAVKATADWVRGAIRNTKPGFRRDYCQQIIREYGIFNVRGLGLINTFTLKLDQVFVDLRIAPSNNPARANANLIAQQLSTENLAGNRQVWDFLRTRKSKDGEAVALAIIGAPGCGKTTLMQYVALVMAGNRQRKYRLRAYVPVLLFLRDHVAAIADNPSLKLGTLAQNHLTKQFPKLTPPSDWFERQLERGKCLVLLDGFDEVADKDKRQAMSQWVDNQIRNYPACHFVITSRPQGYRDAPLQRANIVIEVQPFNAEQVKTFVSNWYLTNEVVASGNVNNEEVRERATKDAEDLLRRLRQMPSLSALTVNPLLLTMIAMVHRYHGALPGSRVELYNEICEVLLGRWRQAKGVKDNLTAAQKRAVLQPLAAAMMKRKLREITADEAAKIISPMLQSVGINGNDAKSALQDFQASSGLLLEREAGKWSFAHLTFQEYLTAAHWLDKKDTTPYWDDVVEESWWYETLRLYAAQSEATGIIEECLLIGKVETLTLANDCLEEGKLIDPEIRKRVERRIVHSLESDDPKLRRLAAEVKLQSRLKKLQRIDDDCEIDPEFIHCAEYQLFLDDLRIEGQYHQPDHWLEFTFPKGQARESMVGIRAEDAVAFGEWLTQKQGGEAVYRLPKIDEVEPIKSSQTKLGAWSTVDSNHQLGGMSEGEKRNLAGQLTTATKNTLPFAKEVITENRDRERDLALVFDHAHARALAHTLDLAHARAHTLDLAHILDLAHTRDRALDLDRALALDLVRALALDLVRALDLDLAPALARDLAHTRDLALALARALARARNEFDKVGKLILLDQIRDAQQAVVVLKDSFIISVSRIAHLIDALLGMSLASDFPQYRLASRQYAAHFFEYAYHGYDLLRSSNRTWWQRLLGAKSNYEANQQTVLQAYWWMQILLLREEGKLPAWEGIRIVRERKQV